MDLVAYLWPLVFPLLGVAIALIHIRVKGHEGAKRLETVLMWQLAIGLGLNMAYSGFGHLVIPDQVAESIGWPPGSPFQREVGMWDVAMGIVGLLCLKFKSEGYWTATIIGTGIFLIGAGLGHVYEMVAGGNFAPNNAGAMMYMDLFYPLVLAGLLIWLHRKREEEAGLLP
ncbi:DUF6790 family protein [Methanogenium organophilum]|uniref:Uncharacterized protein n=1 Tax=Methanogenium organophilum TaxID=2199 RepID=A0A9X9S6A2_METOG|nr:DUF6790 family protein [Methanogenium organophilum]WAI02205.1 hypothetical protein OU421_04850 [Methanogenium organophilum]